MFGVSFTLTGDRKLDRIFAGFEEKLQKKILRPAVRNAAKVMLPVQQHLTPVVSGRTKRQLKIRAIKRTRKGVVGINVLSRGEGMKYYDPFVDLGTKKIKARRYRRLAFVTSERQALQTAISDIKAGIAAQAGVP